MAVAFVKTKIDKMKLKPGFIALTIFFFAGCLNVIAQKELNYIYLFDCTESMKGGKGEPNIWETTKQYLKDDLSNLPDDANVFIVPFQDNAHTTIQSIANRVNWSSIESKVEHYIKATHSGTNIVAAWDVGMQYLDSHKYNYFFILTDGNDTKYGIEELCKRIREWCKRNDSSHVFYVMLTNNARNAQIEEAARSCKNVTVIPPGEHYTPKPIVKLTPNNITINSDELTETHEVNITSNGEFNANISTKDKIFKPELEKGKFEKGKAKIKFNLSSHELPSEDSYNFKCEISSDELTIVNPEISITIINLPEKTLDLSSKNEEEIYLGRAKYYPAFLFVPKKQQTILSWDLRPIFNNHANNAKSEVTFEITNDDPSDKFDIFFNNDLKSDHRFKVSTDQDKAILGIRFIDNTKEGKHYFQLSAKKTDKLNRINNVSPDEFTLSLRARYQTVRNPLLKGLIWLGVLVVSVVGFIALLHRLSNARIKYNIGLTSPVLKALLRKNEARKLVLTSNKKLKQNILHRILHGKTKYVYDDFWQDTFELTAANKGVRISRSNIYECKPHGGVLRPNEDNNGLYSLMNSDTGQTITIKIN